MTASVSYTLYFIILQSSNQTNRRYFSALGFSNCYSLAKLKRRHSTFFSEAQTAIRPVAETNSFGNQRTIQPLSFTANHLHEEIRLWLLVEVLNSLSIWSTSKNWKLCVNVGDYGHNYAVAINSFFWTGCATRRPGTRLLTPFNTWEPRLGHSCSHSESRTDIARLLW